MINRWIQFPVEQDRLQSIRADFFNRYNFPSIVGAIDCTHVAIIAPAAHDPVHPAAAYFNRKGYYSINVQIICDANLRILNMNARFPGSVHDSAIWMMSNINQHLRREYIRRNIDYHLIGDEGYPLLPWLLIPYAGNFPGDSPEGRFNSHHGLARMCIERLNGRLKSRFRCLLRHRTLHHSPIKAGSIIYTCGVMHNIAEHFNAGIPPEEVLVPNDNGAANNINNGNQNNAPGNFFLPAIRKRDGIRNNYFM